MLNSFKLLTLLIFLFYAPAPTEEEAWLVTYNLNYKVYKSKSTRLKATMQLFIDKRRSVFLDNRLVRMLLLENNKDLTKEQRIGEILSIGGIADRVIIEKSFETATLMHSKEFLSREYLGYTSGTMKAEDWNVLPDTATLFQLKVQKATCDLGGRKWEAWFAAEIPVSDGPYKFSGLPGLIIKLESADKEYSYTLSKIEKNTNLLPLPEIKQVSKAKFNEMKQYLIDNPFAMMESQGHILASHSYNGKEQTREEAVAMMRKSVEDKNYIEID